MSRLLLISYEFPPKGGTQSQHVAKLAKGLAQQGWDVDVLTVADPPASTIDLALLEEVGAHLRVHTAWSLEPTRLVQLVKRLREGRRTAVEPAAAPAGRSYTSLPRWAIRLIQAFFIPDEKVGWTGWAVREARRLHAEEPFDVILATGPSYTAYGVGRKLARVLGLPWLADLRDPITGGYFFKPVTPLHRALMLRFERRVVISADRLIAATDGITDDLVLRYPQLGGRIETIPNGFDAADFAGPQPPPHRGFEVAYVGAFQATIRPDAFLEAFRRLRDADPAFREDARVRFVGGRDAETDEAVQSRGLDVVVERVGFVTHFEAVTAMRAADVLLLVLGPERESAGILTSKLPEYLGSRRPVLALVPPGIAADIVDATGTGAVVPPLDTAATEAALRELYERWREGALAPPAEEVVERFDRDVLARRVSELLASLITA